MPIFEINIFGLNIAPTYYGLMYVLAFLIGYYILNKRKILQKNDLDDLFLYIFFGVILGGRVGYILFYDLTYYKEHITEIFAIWRGGMSFFGGVIGVIISIFLFAKKYKFSFLEISDEITSILPIGLFLGRIGNYINKELLGFPYTGFLAVEKNGNFYFPSPLLEAFLEGIILYIILFFAYKKKKFNGFVSCMFLIFYSIFRIFVETFFRTPDPQIGYILGFLTIGSILSFIMFIIGILIFIYLKNGLKN